MGTPNDEPADGAPPSGADFIRQFLPTSPYVGHLGIELFDMAPNTATLKMPFTQSLVTIGTVVHGGAIASLIDTAAMVAAWSASDVPAKLRGATVGMTVTYLEPAQGQDLYATARVLRSGLMLINLDVEVRTTSGLLVAVGLVTYKLG